MKVVAAVVLALAIYMHNCNADPVSNAKAINDGFLQIGQTKCLNYESKSRAVSRRVSPFTPDFAKTLDVFKNKGVVAEEGKTLFKSTVNALSALDGVVNYGQSSWPQWMDHYHKLSADIKSAYTFITDMKLYHADHQYHDAALRFRGQYESRIPSIRQFFHGIVNKQPFLGQQTLFSAAAQEYNYDLDKVQNLMTATMEYLVMGSIVETTDLAFKAMLDGRDYSADIESIAIRWDDWMKQMNKEVDSAVDLVKTRFRDRLRSDIKCMAARYEGLSNREFANVLHSNVTAQYFYKDLFTLVYNPIKGGYYHYVGAYGGDIQFRLHGRNIMVASVEKGWRPKCLLSYDNFLKYFELTCAIKSSEQWFLNLWEWDNETAALAVIEHGKHDVWYRGDNPEYHHTCNQDVIAWPRCSPFLPKF